MRISFVAPPFAGHLNPILPLALAARDAGYEVEIVTGPRKAPVLAQLGLPFQPMRSIGPDTLESIANWDKRVGNSPIRLLGQLRQNLRVVRSIHLELLDVWKLRPPSLVVADFMAPVAGTAAEALGIPWITAIPTPFAIEQSTGTPTYFGGLTPQSVVRDALARQVTRLFKGAAFLYFRSQLREIGIPHRLRADGTEAVYSPRAILGFGLRELEFERDWPKTFRMIGPVINSPEACPDIPLPPSGRKVLLTLGTHLLWAKQSLLTQSKQIASLMPEVHFVVSLGQPAEAGAAAQRPASNLEIHPFVPYARDLARFDAVIHHGGAGVTYAAILAGIPSLVIPHDYDQFDYAARIAHHRLGIRIPTLEPEQVRDSLIRLLSREQWPALSTFCDAARRYNPAREFLDTVRQIIG
jgi:UDP:flavonoid glycosyltransferase YjiC (YdhE family)